MENFKEVVEGIINAEFGKDAADLELLESGRVAGFVVSEIFNEKTDKERQDMVWDILEKELQPPDLLNVSFLIALTPDEEEAYAE